jgi:hypothetical protein
MLGLKELPRYRSPTPTNRLLPLTRAGGIPGETMIINEHTNSDGEAFYSTRDNDGEMIYSSTEDFEVTWDQATEDAEQEAEQEAWVKAEDEADAADEAEARRIAEAAREAARMAEAARAAAEAARMAAAEAEARAAAWISEAGARAINPHLTAQEAAEAAEAAAARTAAAAAEARAEAWAAAEAAEAAEEAAEEAEEAAEAAEAAEEAAEAPEFWIIDLDHPAESRGEFPASGPYPSQAAAEKYIISDTKAIWADSSPFSSQRFCRPLKIVKVVRTVQPEVTATVSLVDSH